MWPSSTDARLWTTTGDDDDDDENDNDYDDDNDDNDNYVQAHQQWGWLHKVSSWDNSISGWFQM